MFIIKAKYLYNTFVLYKYNSRLCICITVLVVMYLHNRFLIVVFFYGVLKMNIIASIEKANVNFSQSKFRIVKVTSKSNPNKKRFIQVISTKESIETKRVSNPMPMNQAMRQAFNKAQIRRLAS